MSNDADASSDVSTEVEPWEYGSPTLVAGEALQSAVVALIRLAQQGDSEAILALLKSTNFAVHYLNQFHAEYSQGAAVWPVILSAGKEKRDADLYRGGKLNIGGIIAKAKGQPRKLDPSSERGFVISIFNHLRALRLVIKQVTIDGLINEPDFRQFGDGSRTIPMPHDSDFFAKAQSLNDYGPSSRRSWIELSLELLAKYPVLVPESIAMRTKGKSYETGKACIHPQARGDDFESLFDEIAQGIDFLPDTTAILKGD